MGALEEARNAYGTTQTSISSSRSIEFDAFARVTHRLRNIDRKKNYAGFVKALHDNRHLWTLLAVDVADAQNGLSEQLRAQIFYLAEFTAQHTSKVMAGEADANVLVEINASIMRGLRPSGGKR